MVKNRIIIATRESPLALYQAEWIKQRLLYYHPQLTIDLLGITTQADKLLTINLSEIGGKGWFVKELEEALLDGRADIAVHSMKDVPMELPPGLCLPIICEREDARDVFVSEKYPSLHAMPRGSRMGTSSLRRRAQLGALRPDIHFHSLRGNIHTRLKRLEQGDFDAIVLAAAGLKRMNLAQRIRSYLSYEESLPAAGQGALGIECRQADEDVRQLLIPLNDSATSLAVIAERAVCRRLEGGCQLPVAAYATLHAQQLEVRGLVADETGSTILRSQFTGPSHTAELLGTQVAEALLAQGAQKILQNLQVKK
jgi:hydroxymethylbilane synthase